MVVGSVAVVAVVISLVVVNFSVDVAVAVVAVVISKVVVCDFTEVRVLPSLVVTTVVGSVAVECFVISLVVRTVVGTACVETTVVASFFVEYMVVAFGVAVTVDVFVHQKGQKCCAPFPPPPLPIPYVSAPSAFTGLLFSDRTAAAAVGDVPQYVTVTVAVCAASVDVCVTVANAVWMMVSFCVTTTVE